VQRSLPITVVHGFFAEPLQFDRNKVVNLVRLFFQAKMHHEILNGEQFTDFSIPDFIQQFDGIVPRCCTDGGKVTILPAADE